MGIKIGCSERNLLTPGMETLSCVEDVVFAERVTALFTRVNSSLAVPVQILQGRVEIHFGVELYL